MMKALGKFFPEKHDENQQVNDKIKLKLLLIVDKEVFISYNNNRRQTMTTCGPVV